jgi:hypothetical protein
MLISDVPLPTVTVRIFMFPLTRGCFFVTPLAKGATQLGCSILSGVVDRWDVCKWIFLTYDKMVDFQMPAWLIRVISLSQPPGSKP